MDRFSSDRNARPTLHPSERQPLAPVSELEREQPRESFREAKKGAKKGLVTKNRIIAAVIVVAVVVLGIVGWLWVSRLASGVPAYVDTSKYQAVFLVNGEFYFGKIEQVTTDSIKLTDVYYVQKAAATDTKATTTGNKLELIKLGNEVHGPDDMMAINRSQVLYVENLKADGQVVKLIKQDKGQQ